MLGGELWKGERHTGETKARGPVVPDTQHKVAFTSPPWSREAGREAHVDQF